MKQNITLATIKALHQAKHLNFFATLKVQGHRAAARGYMSKDGHFAWFWTLHPSSGEYTIRMINFDTGYVYRATPVHLSRHEKDASNCCKLFCEAYDRDRTFINPRGLSLASEPMETV